MTRCTPGVRLHVLRRWVAPHIQRLVPGAKAVVVLRDPVERAKSLHAFGVQLGWETLDLEDALEAETSRQPWERLYAACEAAGHSGPIVHNEHVAFHTYAARGTYSGLAALVGAFGVQNVFICSLDELSAHPQPTMDRCFAFLGLTPIDLQLEIKNATVPQREAPGGDGGRRRVPSSKLSFGVELALRRRFRESNIELARTYGVAAALQWNEKLESMEAKAREA